MMGISSIGNPTENGHQLEGVKGVTHICYRKAEAQTDVLHIAVVWGDRSYGLVDVQCHLLPPSP